jgi:anti-anti-sigma factor
VRPYSSLDQYASDRAVLRADVHIVAPAQARITASGELEASTSAHLENVVRGCLHEQNARAIEVDVAGVTFLDSAGIKGLLACHRRAHEAGCVFRLTNPTPLVRRVVEITGLLEIFGLPA